MFVKTNLQKIIVALCCVVFSLSVIAEEFKISALSMKTDQQNFDIAGNGLAKPKGTKLRIASYNVFRTRIFTGNRVESWKRLHNALNPDIWFLNEMFYQDDYAPDTDAEAFVQHVRDFTGQSEWKYSWDAKGRYLLTKYNILWSKEISHRVHATWIELPSSVSSKDLLAINVHYRKDDHGRTTRDFIQQVRAGNYSGAKIPSDISIIVAGDFNVTRYHTRYNYVADEGFADPMPHHIGTTENATIGTATLSNGELIDISGNEIDFILLQSDVLDCSNSFIPNTLILDQKILDQYGLYRGDVAVKPDGNHDYINGTIDCDHFPQVADFFDSTIPLPNEAEFVSQDVPSNIDTGETVTVSISMKNSGENTWSDSANYVLENWSDSKNNYWDITNVRLNEGEQIATGETKIFEFDITAPSAPGIYDFQWRMQEENVEWFGGLSGNERIAVGDVKRFLDECDALTGWKSHGDLSLNTTENKQGDACIVFNGDGTDEFKKTFTTPYSIGGSESDLALEFWYYVSDPAKLSGANQVELGSGGAPDIDEFNWSLSGLTEGWNHIRLNFSDASKIGNPDLSSVNWFRLYHLKGSVTTMIDGIRIVDRDFNVALNELYKKNIVSFYPNPVYDNGINVEFRVESLSGVSMSVTDMNGALILQAHDNQFFPPGRHEVNIPLDSVFPGTYVLEIIIDGSKQSHKIVVM